jgi:hypothetical protein
VPDKTTTQAPVEERSVASSETKTSLLKEPAPVPIKENLVAILEKYRLSLNETSALQK